MRVSQTERRRARCENDDAGRFRKAAVPAEFHRNGCRGHPLTFGS